MPRRYNPTRDEFLNFLVAQRLGRNRNLGQTTTPVQRFSKLISTAPTRVTLTNRQQNLSGLLKRRKRRRLIQPIGVSPIRDRRRVRGQPVGQVRPIG